MPSNAHHTELMHLLAQYAMGDLSLDSLRTRLDTPFIQTAIAALVGQTVAAGPHSDQITVGNITHANNIAIGAGAIALEIGSFILHLPPPPTVAFQVPHRTLGDAFVGRDQALERLAMLLLDGNIAAITPAVTGMGGIGKTQVATELAHRYRSHFPGGVFWLSMDVPASVQGRIAACAGPGGLNLPNYAALDFEDRVAATRAAWQESVVRLLVFDNLEDPTLLDEWRPTGGGCRVLITSRDSTWPSYSGVQTIPLAPLDTDPALMLLLFGRARRMGTTVATLLADSQLHTAAKAIVTELGGLPLALTLAAAFLEQNCLTTLDRYLAQIQVEAVKHRSLNAELRSALPTNHSTSIIATFAVSQQQLNPADTTDALALRIWQRAAQLAPEPIPTRLLIRAAERDPDSETDQEQVQLSIDRLGALGLIEERPESYALHRLLSAYARSIASNVEQDHGEVVSATITECSAINQAGLPLHGVPYLPHLSILAKREEQTEQQATLLTNLGYLLNAQGNYAEALPLYQRTLAICETALGPLHSNTATSLNNLAGLYESTGNYAEALPLYQRALAICETALGPKHPDTATSLNNLALLHYATGNYAEALPLYQRALAIYETALGPLHPTTALSLNNLAALYESMGNYGEALPLYQRALAIQETTLGPLHPDTATSLNNLAALYYATGNYAEVLPLYIRALTIQETTLGPLHPDTATSLNNLAALYYATDNYTEALPLYQRALTIKETAFGPLHPSIATSLNNLAALYESMGNYTEALPLYQRALAIRETALGPKHPSTQRVQNNLNHLHAAMTATN